MASRRITSGRLRSLAFASAALLGLVATSASAATVVVDVYAKDNNIGGFANGALALTLAAGQAFTVTVAASDLWSAGGLPRWSNAGGLSAVPLYATAGDESGQPAGTLIGQWFGQHSEMGFTAPFGSLVGRIGDAGSFFLIGMGVNGTYSGNAGADSGELRLFYWDGYANGWYGDNSGTIEATVSAVPLPAAAWLLLSGLAGVAVVGRRRRDVTAAA